LAAQFGIRTIPTLLFFKGGEIVDKFVGASTKAKLDEKFKALL
jgi:thioredoxin 1